MTSDRRTGGSLQHPYAGPALIIVAVVSIQAFKFLPDAGIPPGAGPTETLMWGLSWAAILCLAYGVLRTLEEIVMFLRSRWQEPEILLAVAFSAAIVGLAASLFGDYVGLTELQYNAVMFLVLTTMLAITGVFVWATYPPKETDKYEIK